MGACGCALLDGLVRIQMARARSLAPSQLTRTAHLPEAQSSGSQNGFDAVGARAVASHRRTLPHATACYPPAIAACHRPALSPRAIAARYRRVLSCAIGRAIASYRCVLSLCAIAASYRRPLLQAIDVCYRRVLPTLLSTLLSAPSIGASYRYRRSITIDALSLSTLYRYRRCYCPLLESISVFCLCARCAFLTACAHFSVPSARARGSDGHVHMSHAGLR